MSALDTKSENPCNQAGIRFGVQTDSQAGYADGLSGTLNWLEKDLTPVTLPGAGHLGQQDAADLVTSTMRG
jgi:hypothetical protein